MKIGNPRTAVVNGDTWSVRPLHPTPEKEDGGDKESLAESSDGEDGVAEDISGLVQHSHIQIPSFIPPTPARPCCETDDGPSCPLIDFRVLHSLSALSPSWFLCRPPGWTIYDPVWANHGEWDSQTCLNQPLVVFLTRTEGETLLRACTELLREVKNVPRIVIQRLLSTSDVHPDLGPAEIVIHPHWTRAFFFWRQHYDTSAPTVVSDLQLASGPTRCGYLSPSKRSWSPSYLAPSSTPMVLIASRSRQIRLLLMSIYSLSLLRRMPRNNSR